MSASLLRVAARGLRARPVVLSSQQPLMARSAVAMPAVANFSTSVPRRAEHAEETFEEFTAR